MSERRLCICLFVVGLVFLFVLTTVHLYQHPPLFYYTQLTIAPSLHELPTRLIKRAFRIVADKELPSKADGLRAIFSGGKERAILVKLQTDSKGIEYILETFSGPIVTSKVFDASSLRILTKSKTSVLPHASLWQKRLGISFFNQESIESGRLLHDPGKPSSRPGYRVFIDDQRSIVYIEAWSY